MAGGQSDLGPWMARIMREKSLTRRDVGDACDVDPTTVSRWITKGARPSYAACAPLAVVLGQRYELVLEKAGYVPKRPTIEVEPVEYEVDELAAELDLMLRDSSPLTDAERDRLRLVTDAQMEPYRTKMRPKRRVG